MPLESWHEEDGTARKCLVNVFQGQVELDCYEVGQKDVGDVSNPFALAWQLEQAAWLM